LKKSLAKTEEKYLIQLMDFGLFQKLFVPKIIWTDLIIVAASTVDM